MSVRFVCPLAEQQRELLECTMKNDASHRARMRAHGLVLRSEGITIKAIAKIYHVDRDTVAHTLVLRACRKTPLRVMGCLLAPPCLSTRAVFMVLSDLMTFFFTCRPGPDPASACSD